MTGRKPLDERCDGGVEAPGSKGTRTVMFWGDDMGWSNVKGSERSIGWLRRKREKGLFGTTFDFSEIHECMLCHIGAVVDDLYQ